MAARRRFSTEDAYFFREGTHTHLDERLGCHVDTVDGEEGAWFAVWAPMAKRVSVVGNFNDWTPHKHRLRRLRKCGVFETFIPAVKEGDLYKFHIVSKVDSREFFKADPFGTMHECPPRTASVIRSVDGFTWSDQDWMQQRGARQALDAPQSIYEMHIGSWRRPNDEPINYRELAEPLVKHINETGFTHVEFMPIMEHPYVPSWGYQTTGYYAPTRRFGTPRDFQILIDKLHQAGIGVILDWVPSHFPTDEHGLAQFDGSYLFEHADPRQGFHPDWKTLIFNFNLGEVRSFLISNACFWLRRYHVDGIRVDAVASMLYLDYSRDEGEWIANKYGGRENLEAIEFLRQLHRTIYAEFPDIQSSAEESTAWPMVTGPVHVGGLGFGLKWDMGWMHDTLEYFGTDPIARKYEQEKLTFRSMYAGSENFIMPLSHDEVVHGKGSLLAKMHGDRWQKFANLRALYGWMYAQPGKKLLFMGSELAPWSEWSHDDELPWDLLEHAEHRGVYDWILRLNELYRELPALHRGDHKHAGFEWVDCHDFEQSVLILLRHAPGENDPVLVIFNLTPMPREGYRIGVPSDLNNNIVPAEAAVVETSRPGTPARTSGAVSSDSPAQVDRWKLLACSDAEKYGGAGMEPTEILDTEAIESHGHRQSIVMRLPPLSATFLKRN